MACLKKVKLVNAVTTLNSALENKSETSHVHDNRYYTKNQSDDRYYTKSQINNELSNLKFEIGTSIITVSGKTASNKDISFTKTYSSTPIVIGMPNSSWADVLGLTIYNVTKTGCRLQLHNASATETTAPIMYLVVGK